MSDQPGTDLAEVASEAYGERYVGRENTPAPRERFDTVEQAAARLRETRKPETSGRQVRKETPPQTQDDGSEAETSPAMRWSDQDIQDLATFNSAAERQAAAAQGFAAKYQRTLRQLGAASFEELKEADPAEASALQQEFIPIWKGAQHVQQMRNTIAAALRERELDAAAAQLHRDLPDLAQRRDEFISWARDQGYSDEQILGEQNPELIKMAYRAFKAETRPTATKAAKFRKQTRPQKSNSAVDKARDKLRSTGRMDDAVALLQARRKTA